MMDLCFEKWEGLGNDFILIEGVAPAAALVRRLCDRRLGIGGDGVLVLERRAEQRWRMVVLNADGSRPEMCGNGLRCAAARAIELAGAPDGEALIDTDAGPRACRVSRQAADRYMVQADMGVAEVGAELLLPGPGEAQARRFVRVSVGNPHAVSFEPFGDGDIAAIGPVVEHMVAGGTNVELCRATADDRLDVVVWERGVGLTRACGTGACAVAAAAAARGLVGHGAPVEVRLPGGSLVVTVSQARRALTVRGPARRVFSGQMAVD